MIPTTMRAAQGREHGSPLAIRSVAVPEPGRGELIVELEACGICHSDLHIRDGDENLPAELYPVIPGHEGIGRVVARGDQTDSRFALGDRVGLPWLFETCLDCEACLTGGETSCPNQLARGIHRAGAFAEYAIVKESFACRIPDEIRSGVAAPLLCAGLTAWSALRKTTVRPGRTVLVIGAGGLGQFAILIAKAHGARVFVIDRDQLKLDEAMRRGADRAFHAGPDAGRLVSEAGGAHIVLNFAPTPAVWATIEAAANPMCEIVVIALVHDPVPLSMMWLIEGGHKVLGSSVGSRQELRDLLDFAVRHPLEIDIELVALDDVDEALDRLRAGDVRGRLCVDFAVA